MSTSQEKAPLASALSQHSADRVKKTVTVRLVDVALRLNIMRVTDEKRSFCDCEMHERK
jgi:hypothetical protein